MFVWVAVVLSYMAATLCFAAEVLLRIAEGVCAASCTYMCVCACLFFCL